MFCPSIFTLVDGWAWQLVKTVVQVADFNHHELISHLAQTHLILDPVTVCTHRQRTTCSGELPPSQSDDLRTPISNGYLPVQAGYRTHCMCIE